MMLGLCQNYTGIHIGSFPIHEIIYVIGDF